VHDRPAHLPDVLLEGPEGWTDSTVERFAGRRYDCFRHESCSCF